MKTPFIIAFLITILALIAFIYITPDVYAIPCLLVLIWLILQAALCLIFYFTTPNKKRKLKRDEYIAWQKDIRSHK